MRYPIIRSLLLTVFVCGCAADSPRPFDEAAGRAAIVAWNEEVLEVAELQDGFLTLKGLRTAALMHLAMHDALNAIEPRYETYTFSDSVPEADPLGAILHAAAEIAEAQYPEEALRFTGLKARLSAGAEDDRHWQRGMELGRRAARAILEQRASDGWDSEAEYRWHPMGPGVYAEFGEHSGTPEGFVFGAGWAIAKPFMLDDLERFRSPPPPAIDSVEYTQAFDEVRQLGRFDSSTRTADQTHLAFWWKEFVEKSHNRLARQLIESEMAAADGGELDLWQTARGFALLQMSIYDAYISAFDNKYLYNHWRPYTAIRWASNDGNPDTVAEPDWDNTHRHTYAFPSYPSAHGTACAAAMSVLTSVFGDQRPFTMWIPTVDSAGPFSEPLTMEPPTRSFESFSAAAMECALSRVSLGIHFRYDSIAGNQLGAQVGEFAVAGFLRPIE